MVTAFIIMTISANLVLSLGMVGALSIIRFRSAIKDPLDVGFLFWGVAAGITAGAGLYFVALIGTVFVAVLYIVLTLIKKPRRSYLLVVRYGTSAEDNVKALLGAIRYKLKNKSPHAISKINKPNTEGHTYFFLNFLIRLSLELAMPHHPSFNILSIVSENN